MGLRPERRQVGREDLEGNTVGVAEYEERKIRRLLHRPAGTSDERWMGFPRQGTGALLV